MVNFWILYLDVYEWSQLINQTSMHKWGTLSSKNRTASPFRQTIYWLTDLAFKLLWKCKHSQNLCWSASTTSKEIWEVYHQIIRYLLSTDREKWFVVDVHPSFRKLKQRKSNYWDVRRCHNLCKHEGVWNFVKQLLQKSTSHKFFKTSKLPHIYDTIQIRYSGICSNTKNSVR